MINWPDVPSVPETLGSPKPPPWLWHYTSLETFRKIVEGQTLQLTHINYLNDATEFEGAINAAVRFLQERSNRLAPDLRDGKPGARLLAAGLHEAISEYTTHAADVRHVEHYVFCLSACEDCLSQWRGYCLQDDGVAIGIEGSALETLAAKGYWLQQCVYGPSEYDRVMDVAMDRLLAAVATADEEDYTAYYQMKRVLVARAWELLPRYKHDKFNEEREWRLVTTGGSPIPREFRPGAPMVPYISVPIDRRLVGRVMVGPWAHKELIAHSLNLWLERFNLGGASASSIPYRPLTRQK
jgi:hypothetical protein